MQDTNTMKNVLVFDVNKYHAYGLQVYEKTLDIYSGGVWIYAKNRETVSVTPTGEIPMSNLGLEWNDIEQPYVPTLKERIRSLFTGGKLPSMMFVRPKPDSIVIVEFDSNGRTFFEVAEFDYTNEGHPRWSTSIDIRNLRMLRWAYIPQHIVDFAKNSVRAKAENEQ